MTPLELQLQQIETMQRIADNLKAQKAAQLQSALYSAGFRPPETLPQPIGPAEASAFDFGKAVPWVVGGLALFFVLPRLLRRR